ETHYRTALAHAPRDPIAHFNLAGLLEESGRAQDAVASYQHAIAADPDFADAHYNLGLLLDSLGRRTSAMTHLRAARRRSGRRSAQPSRLPDLAGQGDDRRQIPGLTIAFLRL